MCLLLALPSHPNSILRFLGLAMCPVPYLFYIYGESGSIDNAWADGPSASQDTGYDRSASIRLRK